MSRPGSSDQDSKFSTEKTKRRLSLRLQPGAGPEKRIKSESEGSSLLRDRRSRSKDSAHLLDESEPFTRSSQASRHSQQSQQSGDSDDDRPSSRSGDQQSTYRGFRDIQVLADPSHSSTSTSGDRLAPRWVPEQERSFRTSHSSSSRSSRSSSQRQYPNFKSDDTERQPSPPAMTLSSGQPLVNPPLKTQAAFVGKLYSMLEDDEIGKSGLIHWSAGGQTFTCPNPTEFSRTVLPRFFKHNNWQSFVRQLNMYSFNKVNDLYATSNDPTAWEFRHPQFRQGAPHLLAQIKRKTTRPSNAEGQTVPSPTEEMSTETRSTVPGWFRENHPGRIPSDQMERVRSPPRGSREVFGLHAGTGERIEHKRYETARPVSGDNVDNRSRSGFSPTRFFLAPSSSRSNQQEFSTSRTPRVPSGASFSTASHLDLPQRSSSQRPAPPVNVLINRIGDLENTVSSLQDKLAKLNETINRERMDNARFHLDSDSYVLELSRWIPDAPLNELRALQEELRKRSAATRQKYETLMASESLASLATGGPERRLPPDHTLPPRAGPPLHLAPQHYSETIRESASDPRESGLFRRDPLLPPSSSGPNPSSSQTPYNNQSYPSSSQHAIESRQSPRLPISLLPQSNNPQSQSPLISGHSTPRLPSASIPYSVLPPLPGLSIDRTSTTLPSTFSGSTIRSTPNLTDSSPTALFNPAFSSNRYSNPSLTNALRETDTGITPTTANREFDTMSTSSRGEVGQGAGNSSNTVGGEMEETPSKQPNLGGVRNLLN